MTAPNEVTRDEFDALKAQVDEIVQRHNRYDEGMREWDEFRKEEEKVVETFRVQRKAGQSHPNQIQDLAERPQSLKIGD